MSETRSFHLCVSVRGVLSRSDREILKQWRGCVTNDAGKKCTTALEIREAFFDELAKGREVVPLGECDNFDYKTGCKGHTPKAKEPDE